MKKVQIGYGVPIDCDHPATKLAEDVDWPFVLTSRGNKCILFHEASLRQWPEDTIGSFNYPEEDPKWTTDFIRLFAYSEIPLHNINWFIVT